MATATRNQRTNGRQPSMSDAPIKVEVSQEALAAAAEYEAQIEAEARAVWVEACGDGDAVDEAVLTPGLFRRLRPLLRRPIPEGYISEVTFGKGKPYPSKGIKSLQVQVDRLDNVLGEFNWGWETRYLNDQGTLAEVTVWVVNGEDGERLIERKARGGVDRGSSAGNTHKGTETNAAKLAFARLGVGHEVYIGLTDLDPDVSEEAAQAAAESGREAVPPVETIDGEAVADLVTRYEAIKAQADDPDGLARDLKLELGAMRVPTPSLNKAFGSLTPGQRDDVRKWLDDRSQS